MKYKCELCKKIVIYKKFGKCLTKHFKTKHKDLQIKLRRINE